jgi:hypothetical protein
MTLNRKTPTTTTDPGGITGAAYATQVAEEMLDAANRGVNIFTVTGTNTLVATGTPPVLAAMAEGQKVWLQPVAANTGAVTFNPDGTGAVAVLDMDGNALSGGELSTTRAVEGHIDSTGALRLTGGINASTADNKYAILTNTRVGAGGSMTGGTWNDLAINTKDADTIGLTFSAPTFSVPESRNYDISAVVGFEDADSVYLRLYNITDAVAVAGLYSPAGRFDTAGITITAQALGRVALLTGKSYKFQAFCADTRATDGQGGANSGPGFGSISLTHAAIRLDVPTAGAAGPAGAAGSQNADFGAFVGDETTTLTTGTGKSSFRVPRAVTLTQITGSLTTASSSGTVTVDVNVNGASILSTKLTLDAGDTWSLDSAVAAVISNTSLAVGDLVAIDIDGAGTAATGLKVYFSGTYT